VLGIRPIDVGVTALVAAIVEPNVAVATGPHQKPLNAVAYTFGAVLVLPILSDIRFEGETVPEASAAAPASITTH
jgi:hypothetical protein